METREYWSQQILSRQTAKNIFVASGIEHSSQNMPNDVKLSESVEGSSSIEKVELPLKRSLDIENEINNHGCTAVADISTNKKIKTYI